MFSPERYHKKCMLALDSKPEPKGQKFSRGSKVKVVDSYWPEYIGRVATVMYTHAHAFDSDSVENYSLMFDDGCEVSWFIAEGLEEVKNA